MANTTWSVTPSDGVINIGNGVFSFPENTTSVDKEYTVSFYSEACGCNCIKTVVIEAAPCKCTVTSNYGDEEHAIGPEAGTDVVVGTIDNCADEVTWEKIDGGEFVGNISVNENNEIVVASISENGGGARYAEYSASCDSILTIWQKKHTGCPSESTIIQTIGRLPDTGGTGITIFKILKNDAYTGYNFSGDTNNIITNFDVSDDDVDNWYNVTANVAANDGGERPIYIKVRLNGGTSVPDEGCLYDSVKLTQKGKCVIEWLGDTECITCDCDCTKLALNEESVSIRIGGCSNMAIGSYSECISTITTEGESWANISATNGELILNVDSNADSSRSTTVTFTYGVSCDSGKSCTKTLTVNQAGDSCGCGSITYEGTEEADPTPTASGFKVNVAVPNGKASAYVSLYDTNNTFLCGITRYQGGTIGAVYNWTAQGTVAKVAVTENGSSCKYLTINGKTGTTYLSKTQINTGSTVTNLDLTRTFDTSDYNDGNALLYFTFQDS